AGQPVSIPPPAGRRAGMHSPPPRRAFVREFSGTYESLPARSIQVGGTFSRVLECPSIQITTISPEDDSGPVGGSYWDGGGGWDRERLYLPLLDSYRDVMTGAGSLSPSPSPASSSSSRGWLSPASSCDSLLVEEDELNEAAAHFCLSPSSRPTSPGGKKRRSSPLASPSTSRRSSYSEDLSSLPDMGETLAQSQAPASCELNIPQKTRKTSLEQMSSRDIEPELTPIQTSPCPLPEVAQLRREPPTIGMDYLSVPPALGWGRTRASAHSPLFRSNALPPLDWPLPSQFDQYELRIEVQPRPHHRAHYETEGSRGAVKASPGGHPVVKLVGYTERQPLSLQVFVGTADDRSIRPHPFYQIHRVTGKMVGTASQESIQAGTKLLDIPLNPENSMTALIDCAGILKLRNSDIELRKGETDVGRKNTRVRLVFRTHLPLSPPIVPPGRVLALQVASLPIECSQRSAQELPVVESISLTSCSTEGGEELLLGGTNFLPTSRVFFMERGSDGKVQWEEEAHVDRDKSNENLLCVQVPAYNDLSLNHPVSVCLYVSNGKRKRSSTHCFKYLPSDLELGFTELLPPMYPRASQPLSPSPSPSPWLDSPYLSSSPSPSHSCSLSPFPASSPISTSPLPPLSHSPYPHCPCPQEMCSSPPSNTSHYQDLCPPPYGRYESWEHQMRPSERDIGPGLKLEGPPDFSGPTPMQHITLEEGGYD
uniref:Nuclear factor of activated T-cells, cytoplasmic 4-like n=1 Tax=Sinocyclocheilus grahami TaxID=75366 RepID=A0A672QPY6_SINGR